MRSTLLFASFLTVLPFISATRINSQPARRDGAAIVPAINLSPGPIFNYTGCRDLPSPDHEVNPVRGLGNLTVENCIITCIGMNLSVGGVGNNKCYCGPMQGHWQWENDAECQHLICPGDHAEFCGSSSTLVVYNGPSS